MRIHHLSCGSLCPHGKRFMEGSGGVLERGNIVCHCLAIEAADGIVLVDTGFGREDARNPRQLGAGFRAVLGARPKEETTAIAQLEALGFEAGDVRHIVITHLDLDHSGGLPDFPEAQVHLLAPELEAALNPRIDERLRYIGNAHWSHGPRWVTHEAGGDTWNGFESVRILPDLDVDIALVPTIGHSRGHTAVAVNGEDGWLLHCGDAYFNHGEIATPPVSPPALKVFQTLMAADNKARKENRERLRELSARGGEGIRIFCSHDPHELERERERERSRVSAVPTG